MGLDTIGSHDMVNKGLRELDQAVENCRLSLKAELKAEQAQRFADMERRWQQLLQEEREENGKRNAKLEDIEKRYGGEDIKSLTSQFAELRDVYSTVNGEVASVLEEMQRRLDGDSEALKKLRDDCKESMQREVRSRME